MDESSSGSKTSVLFPFEGLLQFWWHANRGGLKLGRIRTSTLSFTQWPEWLQEKQPLAYAVPNDNPTFVTPYRQQHLFNAVEVQSEWDADQGTTGNQILKLRIAVRGSGKPLKLTELCLDLSGTDHLSDIDKVHLFIPAKRPVRSSDKKYLAWPENLNKRCCTKWIGMVGSYHRELTISWSLSTSLQTPYPVIF